jgi:hypothetical protein
MVESFSDARYEQVGNYEMVNKFAIKNEGSAKTPLCYSVVIP